MDVRVDLCWCVCLLVCVFVCLCKYESLFKVDRWVWVLVCVGGCGWVMGSVWVVGRGGGCGCWVWVCVCAYLIFGHWHHGQRLPRYGPLGVCVRMLICVCVCVNIYKFICMHMYMYIYSNKYIYTCIYTCIYVYIHIHIVMYMHISFFFINICYMHTNTYVRTLLWLTRRWLLGSIKS